MDQLGRIALRFTGNGFNAQFVELSGGLGREHHMVAQLLKENRPEGEVLKHVEDPGNPHRAPVCLVQGQGFVVKHAVVLIVKEIGNLLLGLLKSKSPLAAVARDKAASAPKLVDGEHTVVVAALAPGHGGGVLKGNDLIQGQHGCFRLAVHVIAFPCNQGSAEGSHDACDVRANCLAS